MRHFKSVGSMHWRSRRLFRGSWLCLVSASAYMALGLDRAFACVQSNVHSVRGTHVRARKTRGRTALGSGRGNWKEETPHRILDMLPVEHVESVVKSETLLPASVALLSSVLALIAFLADKPIIAAVMALLAIASALITSWTAGFVDAKEQVEPQLAKIIAAREKEWAELQLDKDVGKEPEEPEQEIPRRSKLDVAWQAAKTAVFGTSFSRAHTTESASPTSCTPAVSEEASSDSPSIEEMTAPGMDEANLVVAVNCDRQSAEPVTKKAGVSRLMDKSCGDILAAMAQDGWRVEDKNATEGIYSMFLPSVKVDFPVGSVSIPSPEFECRVRDSFESSGEDQEQRLVGELVLQNGKEILAVNLTFPFSTTFSVSASGVAFARIGRIGDAVYLQADVKMGLQIPKVPGITKVMQVFVRNYAKQSTYDCAVALSKGADKIDVRSEAAKQTRVAVATAAAAVVAVEADVAGMATVLGEMMAQPGAAGVTELVEVLPK
eukprot:TRINITY_DN41364_c0_g1_i1.p1 TRINITY_DN41364_c0_g1~~TRINITY_DN41364_c0_g1_i1.p1  ORF type:complete len:493 (-),score=64.71 TRINITY_DN41364_c0_g1_i1:45-1523(-)